MGHSVCTHTWDRLVKYNLKIYCELKMMLGEIFVEDQDLLLAGRRLW